MHIFVIEEISSMHTTPSSKFRHGFSLLEMLTVIAVIGIITSMALAVFGGASQSADDAKNRRNAQEIVYTAAAAGAAGALLLHQFEGAGGDAEPGGDVPYGQDVRVILRNQLSL